MAVDCRLMIHYMIIQELETVSLTLLSSMKGPQGGVNEAVQVSDQSFVLLLLYQIKTVRRVDTTCNSVRYQNPWMFR